MADIAAHITGTVWKIEVKIGQSVNSGDVLVILESMKMEMPVEAPTGGTVREIKIKEGEPVDEGKVLVIRRIHVKLELKAGYIWPANGADLINRLALWLSRMALL